jgi:hypothetical protein
MVFLQNCMSVLQSESGAELCLRSFDASNEDFGVQVEGVRNVVEEEGTEPSSSSSRLLMTLPAVSFMSLCIQCYAHCTDIHERMLLSAGPHEKFGLW